MALPAQAGLGGGLALPYGISFFEMALGVATANGYCVRLIGAVELAPVLGFTAILSLRMPALSWHRFGPLAKNIPLIAATLIMVALEE